MYIDIIQYYKVMIYHNMQEYSMPGKLSTMS